MEREWYKIDKMMIYEFNSFRMRSNKLSFIVFSLLIYLSVLCFQNHTRFFKPSTKIKLCLLVAKSFIL